jgi:hypothetical protein
MPNPTPGKRNSHRSESTMRIRGILQGNWPCYLGCMVCLSHPPLVRIAPGPEGVGSDELKDNEMTLWDGRTGSPT